MASRIALVTGANSGIGLETARALARQGYRTVLACRSAARAEAARADILRTAPGAEVELLGLDLARLQSVRDAAAEVERRFPALHVLVNNAGLVLADRQLTPDGFEATFGINHLGPFLFTQRLEPLLRRSAPARIVNVSSAAHRWAFRPLDDLQAERHYIAFHRYGNSKLMNILFTREHALRLEGSGVTANALHPGAIASGFMRDGDYGALGELAMTLGKPFLLTPQQGARTSIFLATSPQVEGLSGGYYWRSRLGAPRRAGRDPALARALWERSEAALAGGPAALADGPSARR